MLNEKFQREKGLLEYLDFAKRAMPISLPTLVRDRGRSFMAAPLPDKVRRGEMGACFMNAFLLSARTDLIYVEGYAFHIIPVLHAWCVTKEGVVVDPTWDDPEDCAYYGIPLRRDFATRMTLRNKVYGLLAEPRTVKNIYDTDPSKYLAAT